MFDRVLNTPLYALKGINLLFFKVSTNYLLCRHVWRNFPNFQNQLSHLSMNEEFWYLSMVFSWKFSKVFHKKQMFLSVGLTVNQMTIELVSHLLETNQIIGHNESVKTFPYYLLREKKCSLHLSTYNKFIKGNLVPIK